MIAIVNTSLLNPGTQNLKVYYQNVQGLIPFSNLSFVHPVLDRTKIGELNCYIHINRPDVVILNETWLKKSISDHEVIEDPVYKIFRKDRKIVLEAVKNSFHSSHIHPFAFADETFRKDREIVLAAVKKDSDALRHAGESLKNDPDILAIVNKNKKFK